MTPIIGLRFWRGLVTALAASFGAGAIVGACASGGVAL